MTAHPDPPLVSAILVNRNCGPLIEMVMPTLVRQTYPRLEVVVVDNGSQDGSVDYLKHHYPAVRILALGENRGFSHALNAGIRATAAEFVLSLNFDVVLEPEFVSALVQAVTARPDVGWAAGAMRKLAADGRVLADIDCMGHYLLPSRYVYGYDPARPKVSAYTEPMEVFGASACAALYRRSMLDAIAIGGEIFDEDLFAYLEDVDVDWRAQHRGFTCLFVPAARGAHMRGGTGLHRRPEVAALLLGNRFLVMLKNDESREVLRDIVPIALRTLRDAAAYVRSAPAALPLAAWRVIRLAPRMLRKRREIRRAGLRPLSPVRRFRLETRFLG